MINIGNLDIVETLIISHILMGLLSEGLRLWPWKESVCLSRRVSVFNLMDVFVEVCMCASVCKCAS